MKDIKLEALWSYPVKSCRGITHKEIEVEKSGLKWDRHWMLVDDKGQFQSQRQIPKMALVETALTTESLVLRIDNYAFEVPFKLATKKTIRAKIFKDEVEVLLEDDLVSKQLSEYLNKNVFLVRSQTPQRAHNIHLADSRPIQLANLDSLKALNQQLSKTITIDRFRANLVVSGLGPFKEDELTDFAWGEIQFKVSKPCIRCSIINVDPSKGESLNQEPLLKLKQFHAVDEKPAFGILLVPKNTGTLSLK